MARKNDNSQKAAMWEMMRDYLKIWSKKRKKSRHTLSVFTIS